MYVHYQVGNLYNLKTNTLPYPRKCCIDIRTYLSVSFTKFNNAATSFFLITLTILLIFTNILFIFGITDNTSSILSKCLDSSSSAVKHRQELTVDLFKTPERGNSFKAITQ